MPMFVLCHLYVNEPQLSSKGHASGLCLVDFDLSCLLNMLKDGWQKIWAMHVTLKVGIKEIYFLTYLLNLKI